MPNSFKYTKHEELEKLVADLRNKMSVVTTYVDLIKILKTENNKEIQKYLDNQEEKLIKVMPIIVKFLHDFEDFDLRK
jgi:predicted HicB family RNase H-like nuclease